MRNDESPEQIDAEDAGHYFELGFFTRLDEACDEFFRKRGMPTSHAWNENNKLRTKGHTHVTETNSATEA
jgi:hypothetical protein